MEGRAESPEAMEALGREAAKARSRLGHRPGRRSRRGKNPLDEGLRRGNRLGGRCHQPDLRAASRIPRRPAAGVSPGFLSPGSAAELVALGWDELLEEDGVVIAEWADKFPELLAAGDALAGIHRRAGRQPDLAESGVRRLLGNWRHLPGRPRCSASCPRTGREPLAIRRSSAKATAPRARTI